MEQNEGVVLEEKVEYPIVAGPQFPDAIFQVLCYVLVQTCSVLLEQFNIQAGLFVLDTGILAGSCFDA